MAIFRGKGAMTEVNLLARTYDNAQTKDGKTRFVDVQIDHRDPRAAGQANLHLVTRDVTNPNTGKAGKDNASAYSAGQYDAIKEIAGPNTAELTNAQGERIGEVVGFKANVMPSAKGDGVVVNTKTLKQSEFQVDDKTLSNQYAAMKEAAAAAREQRAATQEQQAEAPTAEQTAEAENEQPALG